MSLYRIRCHSDNKYVVGECKEDERVIVMLNKNTLDVKKCEANQKQHANRQVHLKTLISAEANSKKLFYQKNFLE